MLFWIIHMRGIVYIIFARWLQLHGLDSRKAIGNKAASVLITCIVRKRWKAAIFSQTHEIMHIQTHSGGCYISEVNVRGCPKDEQLAEKHSLENHCEILSTIYQPRTLSSDM